MALVRFCDADGCHEEQPIKHDDDAHNFTDGDWITLFCDEMEPKERHFCSPHCARRWLLPISEHELRQVGLIPSEFPEGTLPIEKHDVRNPGQSWDPRVDTPFPTDDDGDGATIG